MRKTRGIVAKNLRRKKSIDLHVLPVLVKLTPLKDKKGNEIHEHKQECQYVFKQWKLQGCVVNQLGYGKN